MSVAENGVSSDDKILAGLAYLGGMILWIPTVVILLVKKDSDFVKFHALQSLAFIALFALNLAILTVNTIIGAIPILGWIVALVIGLAMGLLSLAVFIYWLIILVKAFMGETMEIPIVGIYIRKNLMGRF